MMENATRENIMWREALRIGVDNIDEQHEGLFKKALELLDAVNSTGEERKQKCISIILFLKDYAIRHFADEEAYQESIGYKDFALHKKIHDEFKKDIGVQEKLLVESDFADKVVKEFTGMLIAWLLYHVSDADQRIVKETEEPEILHDYTDIVCESICNMWAICNILDSKNVKRVEIDFEPHDEDFVVWADLDGGASGHINIVYPPDFVKYLVTSATGFEPENIGELELSLLITVSNFIFQTISELISKDKSISCFAHPATISSKYAIDSHERIVLDTGKGVVGVGITLE